jgi:hypothetical protein
MWTDTIQAGVARVDSKRQGEELMRFLAEVERHDAPFRHQGEGMSAPFWSAPVLVDGRRRGMVNVVEAHHPLSRGDCDLLSFFSEFVAIRMAASGFGAPLPDAVPRQLMLDLLAGDIARAIDNYIINDASNGIAALTWTTSTNQIVAANYGYGNVWDLIALLPAAYDAEAKFLVNKKTLYGKIAQIVDSTGNPIFVPDTVTGVGGRLMGYPVVVDDYVGKDKDELYLGKWTDVVGNLPEDIHVDRDESAGFTSNSILYRGIAVFDSKPAKGDAIVRLVSTTA